MSQKARLGFIGAGAFISARHLITADICPFMEIRAIADLNEELLKKHSAEKEVGYTTTDYKQLLADPDIDIIVIGTKQDLHAKMIVESLEAGKWVWCEKPMCETLEEQAEILAAEEKAVGKLAIGYNRRFAPAYQDAKQFLQTKERPWIISYRLQSCGAYKMSPDNYYYNRAHMVYEGCHILDLASYFMDEAPEKVFMSGDKRENDSVILEYADGSRFNFLCTSTVGSATLEKEYMEIFAYDFAVSVADFIDMRVRGIDGEFDRIYPPLFGHFAEEVKEYGYDFWEMLTTQLVQPDRSENKEKGLTLEKVIRPQKTIPFDVMKYYEKMKHLHWKERNFSGDKGWQQAFEHFAQCFLNKTTPKTANGKEAVLAEKIAFKLLESKEKSMPLQF